MCDTVTVAGPTRRRDNVLASKCESPLSATPLLTCPTFPKGLQTMVAKRALEFSSEIRLSYPS